MTALSDAERLLVVRIAERLVASDLVLVRAGGRAVALQAIEHRGQLIAALRAELCELGELEFDEFRRGYLAALEDVLLTAEAALER